MRRSVPKSSRSTLTRLGPLLWPLLAVGLSSQILAGCVGTPTSGLERMENAFGQGEMAVDDPRIILDSRGILDVDIDSFGGSVKIDWTKMLIVSWDCPTSMTDITDGTSHTLFLGEKHVRPEDYGTIAGGDVSIYLDDFQEPIGRIAGRGPDGDFPLAEGEKNDLGGLRAWQFGSDHPGVCQFVLGDGSVTMLSTSTNIDVLGLLANRKDGQPIPSDFE